MSGVFRATVTGAAQVRAALTALLHTAHTATAPQHGLLVVTAARAGRTVGTLVAIDGDTFTLGCTVLEPPASPALELTSGPTSALAGEVCGVVQDIGDTFAVPATPLPCDESTTLYAADALLLAEQLRRGDQDAVGEAMALAGCAWVPAWLQDLAAGAIARLTVSWLRSAAAVVLVDVSATPHGWGELACDDERLAFRPLTAVGVRERLATACDALQGGAVA